MSIINKKQKKNIFLIYYIPFLILTLTLALLKTENNSFKTANFDPLHFIRKLTLLNMGIMFNDESVNR